MQTHPTPRALISTGTGSVIARFVFDDSPDWWAWYRQYLQTDQWQRKADRCKARAGYTCKRCKIKAGQIRPDGSRAWLEVHHKTYERVGNERASDLECLCEDCHREGHGK